jgi:hypothetical protein
VFAVDGCGLWSGVKDGMLEDSRDGSRWMFLEILLSVGREHVGLEILGQRHPIRDAHLCPGCRDGVGWKFLEILVSVGIEHVGPEILGHMHRIGDTHL